MAKAYGVLPSTLLRLPAADVLIDRAVWNNAVPIEQGLEAQRSEAERKSMLLLLQRDAEEDAG